MSKTKVIEDLIAQSVLAMEHDFFMEACWIQYAILEDRLNSVIRHAYPDRGAQLLTTLRGFDRKLEQITKHIHPQDPDAVKTVHTELLSRLKGWKDIRNALMHDVTDRPDYDSINGRLAELAAEGAELVNEMGNH